MSQELDTTMQLSDEEWSQLSPYVRAIMPAAQEQAFRTITNLIFSTLTESPEVRHRLQVLMWESSGSMFTAQLMLFITMAEKRAFERAVRRGARLLEGGYAEWVKLEEEGSFWSWCYEGCDFDQRQKVANSLGQDWGFEDGSTWQSECMKRHVYPAVLLEDLFKEILQQGARYASADGNDTHHYTHPLLNEDLHKSKRRTYFLGMLARAHGDNRRNPLPSEGLPPSGALSVSDAASPDNGQSVGDSTAPARQEEDVNRRISLDDAPNISSKQPKVAESRDYGGSSAPSLLQSEHQEDETQQVVQAGTPHPKKPIGIDRVSKAKRCKQVVEWLRRLSHQFRASLVHPTPSFLKQGKKTTPEPPVSEPQNGRKHSSQSKSLGFWGGAGLNLRKRKKTGSPATLSSMTKDSLPVASEPTAASQLDMENQLPHSTLDSAAPLQSRTNKSSPHSILEQASLL